MFTKKPLKNTLAFVKPLVYIVLTNNKKHGMVP
jgi:hypothetical protein